jgi:hypothetical protein
VPKRRQRRRRPGNKYYTIYCNNEYMNSVKEYEN